MNKRCNHITEHRGKRKIGCAIFHLWRCKKCGLRLLEKHLILPNGSFVAFGKVFGKGQWVKL